MGPDQTGPRVGNLDEGTQQLEPQSGVPGHGNQGRDVGRQHLRGATADLGQRRDDRVRPAAQQQQRCALAREFGAERVGMVTGDASVNADAPIICCTQEILAKHDISGDQVKLFVAHQANLRIIEHAARRMNLPDENTPRCFAQYNIPAPEETHPARIGAYAERIDEVVDQIRRALDRTAWAEVRRLGRVAHQPRHQPGRRRRAIPSSRPPAGCACPGDWSPRNRRTP